MDKVVALGVGISTSVVGLVLFLYVKVLKGKLKKRVLRGD